MAANPEPERPCQSADAAAAQFIAACGGDAREAEGSYWSRMTFSNSSSTNSARKCRPATRAAGCAQRANKDETVV
jgi:hypothetical protein